MIVVRIYFDADFGQIFLIFDTDFGFRCLFWADFSGFRYGFWELFVSLSPKTEYMEYFKRHIDDKLRQWKEDPRRKPLLIRGARQVDKCRTCSSSGTFQCQWTASWS